MPRFCPGGPGVATSQHSPGRPSPGCNFRNRSVGLEDLAPVTDTLRHLALTIHRGELATVLLLAAHCPLLETLQVVCHGPLGALGGISPELADHRRIARVSLGLNNVGLDGSHLEWLAHILHALPVLEDLRLDLQQNPYLRPEDMRHLAGFVAPARGLRQLHLTLSRSLWNGDAMIRQLAAGTVDAAAGPAGGRMHCLSLGLDGGGLSAWGVQHGLRSILAAHVGSLQSLALRLSNCELGEQHGFRTLMDGIAQLPLLRDLTLDVSANNLRDSCAFMHLCRLSQLQSLALDLSGNLSLSTRAAAGLHRALAGGRHRLRALDLRIGHTCIQTILDDVGPQARLLAHLHTLRVHGSLSGALNLVRAVEPRALRRLHLWLKDASVDDSACVRIGRIVAECTLLEEVVFDLSNGLLSDVGLAGLLSGLRNSGGRALSSVTLHLDRNGLGARCADDWHRTMQALPRLRHLALDLSHNPIAMHDALAVVRSLPPDCCVHLSLRGLARDERSRAALRARLESTLRSHARVHLLV